MNVPPALPQVTAGIDPSRMTPMRNNVRPEANAANDRGRVADDFAMQHIFMLLHRPAEQEQALEQFMTAQTDPASANYHRWLSADEYHEFGPAQSDIDAVTAWLQSEGFMVNQVFNSGMMIDFSGNAGQVRRTFHTEIHHLMVNGRAHVANMSVPQIPAALAPAVVGIVSLNDFRPHTNYRPRPDYTFGGCLFGDCYAVVPADLATIYNFSPLFNTTPTHINGAGQTVALIENTNVYSSSDISTFRSVFNLGSAAFTTAHPGCTNPGIVKDNDVEATLDVEWAAAAAPGAALELVSCADVTTPTTATFGGLIAMQNLLQLSTPPPIWSLSYGDCEADNGATSNAAFKTTYQQAAATGISVFVASGDQGAAACDYQATAATHGIAVNAFASTQYNVAVGGTDFGDTYDGKNSTYWNTGNSATYGSAKSYIDEIPWNDSCASQLLANGGAYYSSLWNFATTYGPTGFCNDSTFGELFLTTVAGSGGPSNCASGTPVSGSGSGGSCAGTAKPSWQSGILGIPADGVRDIPDVSLFAADGVWLHYYVICYSGTSQGGAPCTGAPSGWSGGGGTSFAAPIMAGVQALINQKNGSKQGNPNPVYYQLAKTQYGSGGDASCDSTKGNAASSSCIFYDVTRGDMDVNCTGTHNCYRPSGTNGVLSTSNSTYQPAYGSQTGWDFATGIGTVNVANLVNHWPASSGGATKLVITQQPNSSYSQYSTITVKVSVENAGGQVVTSDTSLVTLSLSGGDSSATLGGTTTVNAVAGVATFNDLSVNKVGTAYKLTATDGGLTPATTTSFNITTAPSATVSFTTQPASNANVAAGAAIPLTVHVVDNMGKAFANQLVTILLNTNPGGATLYLNPVQALTDASGNVSFNASLRNAAIGYSLKANDLSQSGSPAGISNTFNIVAGSAAKLVFSVQPGNVVQGNILGVTAVAEQDQYGNAVDDNTSSVDFTIAACGGSVDLGSAMMSHGVATLSSAQRFYAIASGLMLNAATSSFNVNSATFSVTTNSDLIFSDGLEACRL